MSGRGARDKDQSGLREVVVLLTRMSRITPQLDLTTGDGPSRYVPVQRRSVILACHPPSPSCATGHLLLEDYGTEALTSLPNRYTGFLRYLPFGELR